MQYALTRIPHPNTRYDRSLDALLAAEFAVVARAASIDAALETREQGMIRLHTFECAPLREDQIAALCRISSLHSLFEVRDSLLKPIGKSPYVMAAEMQSILKYKGKTNEMFTRLLINLAAFSPEDDRFNQKLSLLDPLAGKGTTLYCALGYGYDSFGIERDKKEVDEAVTFVSEYCKHERLKHETTKSSATITGKSAATLHRFVTAPTADAYKKGQTLSLTMAMGDTLHTPAIVSKARFDAIVADLPYGIVHESTNGRRGDATLALIRRALPAWCAVLRPGGAVALSFNSYTLKRDDLRAALADAGLIPLSGGPYDAFEHWVEQAVMRDVVVGLKE